MISASSYGIPEIDLTDLDEDQLLHDDDQMIVEHMDGEIDNDHRISDSPSMESRKDVSGITEEIPDEGTINVGVYSNEAHE